MRVFPCVFEAPVDAVAEPQTDELSEAFWVRWQELCSLPRIKVWKRIKGVPVRTRGVHLHGGLLWGLTFWMVEEMSRKPELVPTPEAEP
jgi:hypothetical protein